MKRQRSNKQEKRDKIVEQAKKSLFDPGHHFDDLRVSSQNENKNNSARARERERERERERDQDRLAA